MKKYFNEKLLFTFSISIVLIGCGEATDIGLLSEKNSWLLSDIENVGDFFKVFVTLQLSILITTLILSIFLKRLSYFATIIIHFGWIIWFRDYGVVYVFLIFILPFVLSVIYLKVSRQNPSRRY